MNRVAIVQFVRLASQRLPNKLLEPFGGVPLIDRGLLYLRKLAETTGAVPLVVVPAKDAPLIASAQRHELRILTLDEQASAARIWPEMIAPFTDLLTTEFDVIWDANICCRPFLRQTTGEFIVRQCRELQRPFVGVVRKRGIVWSETSPTPILGAGELADTRHNPHYFEPSHLAYCWPTWALRFTERQLAEIVQPLELRLDWAERIDIDTTDDLRLARAVADAGAISDDR